MDQKETFDPNEWLTLDDFEGVEINPNWSGLEKLEMEKEMKKSMNENSTGFAAADPVDNNPSRSESLVMRETSPKNPFLEDPRDDRLMGDELVTETSPKNPFLERSVVVPKRSKRLRIARKVEEEAEEEEEEEEEKRPRKKMIRKRPTVAAMGPNPPPDMPAQFKNRIADMGGTEIKLVIQKPLFKADILSSQNRFSFPLRQIRAQFLTEREKTILDSPSLAEEATSRIPVLLIEPCLDGECTVNLRKWDLRKSSSYVLNGKWGSVVKRNGLCVGKIVQLWSFRNSDSELCFALVEVNNGGEHGDI